MPDTHTVDVHIPADLARRLGGPGPALDRQAQEALALAAYQAGTLTAYELRLARGRVAARTGDAGPALSVARAPCRR